jgi:hypothetical protein
MTGKGGVGGSDGETGYVVAATNVVGGRTETTVTSVTSGGGA